LIFDELLHGMTLDYHLFKAISIFTGQLHVFIPLGSPLLVIYFLVISVVKFSVTLSCSFMSLFVFEME